MSIFLSKNNGDAFEISPDEWGKALGLARTYGWQPQGDVRIECYRPDGMFDTDWDFERAAPIAVREDDAVTLADALAKAAPDVARAGAARLVSLPDDADLPPLDWFNTAHGRLQLQDLILFCRAGGGFIF